MPNLVNEEDCRRRNLIISGDLVFRFYIRCLLDNEMVMSSRQ